MISAQELETVINECDWAGNDLPADVPKCATKGNNKIASNVENRTTKRVLEFCRPKA
jgi:hypothetical protein